MFLSLDVQTDDLVQGLVGLPHEDLLALILEVDDRVAEYEFTEQLHARLTKVLDAERSFGDGEA